MSAVRSRPWAPLIGFFMAQISDSVSNLFDAIEMEMDRMIRVNLAGEQAAVDILKSQIASTDPSAIESLQNLHHMLDQEMCHLNYFQDQIRRHNYRPTILSPVWRVVANGVGFVTAKFGLHAVGSVIDGIEDTIEHHYRSQIKNCQYWMS